MELKKKHDGERLKLAFQRQQHSANKNDMAIINTSYKLRLFLQISSYIYIILSIAIYNHMNAKMSLQVDHSYK